MTPSSSLDLRRFGGVGTPCSDATSPRGGDASADDSTPEASVLSWPPSRDELVALAARHSQRQIAEMYGVYYTSVHKLAIRLGVKWPRRTRVHRTAAQQENDKVMTARNNALFRPRRKFSGPMETVEEFLAAGGEITKCPTRFAAPVVSGSPFYGNSRRPG